jgi:hypothetical protein
VLLYTFLHGLLNVLVQIANAQPVSGLVLLSGFIVTVEALTPAVYANRIALQCGRVNCYLVSLRQMAYDRGRI